jgi:hypothetical protein
MENPVTEVPEPAPPSLTVVCPHCHGDVSLDKAKEVECSGCQTTTISVLTKRCANPDCENTYCRDCRGNLNKHGYCGECEEISCDGCGNDFERGTGASCPKCKNTDFCPDCSPEMVDPEVGCVDCLPGDLKVECQDNECSKNVLKAKAALCKNYAHCDTAFCKEHSKQDLDGKGYCEDCGTFECDGCQERFEMGDGIRCTNQSCNNKSIFCKSCQPRLTTTEGVCDTCSKQEVWTCDGCQRDFIQSKVKTCKNVNKCQQGFCDECVGKGLVDGICAACRVVECSSCRSKVDYKSVTHCSNGHCQQKQVYCGKCAHFNLDTSKLCPDCSPQPSTKCGSCERRAFTQFTATCANCKRSLCRSCEEELIGCTKCSKKVCPRCGSRCKTCQKPYCNSCTNFDGSGLCPEHRKKQEEKKKGFWARLLHFGA